MKAPEATDQSLDELWLTAMLEHELHTLYQEAYGSVKRGAK